MLRRCPPAVLLAAALAAPAAGAAERLAGYELTPFAGFRLGGAFEGESATGDPRDLELDDGGSMGLLVNLPAGDPGTQWELLVSHQSTDVEVAGLLVPDETVFSGLDVTYFQAGGTYILEDRPVQPYVAAGLGVARFDPDEPGFDAEDFFSFSLATGLRVAPARRLGLRLEARVFGSVIRSDTDIFCETPAEEGTCLVLADADIIWQWELLGGLTLRF